MKPIELPGLVTKGDESAWALTSADDAYRYALGRCGDPLAGTLDVYMLNPSKARHDIADMTMNKVVHFAKASGHGGALIRNLSAFSATDPRELGQLPSDILLDPLNLEVLALSVPLGIRLAAWGNFPNAHVRSRLVRAMGVVKAHANLHVLGLTQSGEPKHPCRLAHATPIVPWSSLL